MKIYTKKIKRNYVPTILTKKDREIQKKQIIKSRKAYRRGQYISRKKIESFHSKPSHHVLNAQKLYGVKNINPTKQLAKKTKCSLKSLKKIVNKGMGAYYSSGSRPNQTAQSWGLARLASAITGGKAAKIDYSILKKGCFPKSPVLKLAKLYIK
jgi:hypothetical protein